MGVGKRIFPWMLSTQPLQWEMEPEGQGVGGGIIPRRQMSSENSFVCLSARYLDL